MAPSPLNAFEDCPPGKATPSDSQPAGGTPTAAGGHAERAIADIASAVNTVLRDQVVRVGARAAASVPPLSTGYPALDAATGLGGLPRGRITEIVGRTTSGRETIATRTVAAAVGACAWVDVAGLVDVDALARTGVDLGRLYILRPPDPIDALAIAGQLLAGGHFEVVVLDAMTDMPPGGATTRAVEQFVRIVTPALGRSTTICLVLSSPEREERALRHAAALRIGLVKVGLIRAGGVFRGWRTRATVLKASGRELADCGIEVWL